MKLTVVGSTGRTGRHVLAEGLRRGHDITAFTRRPDALTDTAALAGVVSGDARDGRAVRRAIGRADAVIAIVSAGGRAGPHHTAEVAATLLATMADCGIRRLVMTSAYPIVADKPRLLVAVLRRAFAAAYADAAAMERLVSASDRDWTIARFTRLLDKPPTGVRISRDLFDKPSSITRADAATALLDLAEDPAYARCAVNVAGP
jgi:putative NADH-flavin reductase